VTPRLPGAGMSRGSYLLLSARSSQLRIVLSVNPLYARQLPMCTNLQRALEAGDMRSSTGTLAKVIVSGHCVPDSAWYNR
jgi:hypothetical protein